MKENFAKPPVKEKFQCEFCISSFPTENNLKEHIDFEHTVNLPHRCERCDVSFSKKPDLKRHIAPHVSQN